MVKVEITGNYNVLVADLKIEFTPSRPVKILTDDEFDGSNDIASFIRSGIIKVTKDVEEIEKFENLEDLTKEFLKGFKLLMPFYLKTKEI